MFIIDINRFKVDKKTHNLTGRSIKMQLIKQHTSLFPSILIRYVPDT